MSSVLLFNKDGFLSGGSGMEDYVKWWFYVKQSQYLWELTRI